MWKEKQRLCSLDRILIEILGELFKEVGGRLEVSIFHSLEAG